MALITCDECGEGVSSKAATCPKCGAPVAGSSASPIGGFQKGVTTRPDFWHDPNVGAIAAGIVVIFIIVVIGLRGCE